MPGGEKKFSFSRFEANLFLSLKTTTSLPIFSPALIKLIILTCNITQKKNNFILDYSKTKQKKVHETVWFGLLPLINRREFNVFPYSFYGSPRPSHLDDLIKREKRSKLWVDGENWLFLKKNLLPLFLANGTERRNSFFLWRKTICEAQWWNLPSKKLVKNYPENERK